MRIGIVVDGDAESQALKLLTQRISIRDVELLNPIYADMQPKSTPEQIAQSAKSKIAILKAKRVDGVVVLIDREDNQACPGDFAKKLEEAFNALRCPPVSVVVKDRKLENWLIADVSVFERLRSRYKITKAFRAAVSPNKADNVADAKALLNKIVISGEYHKRRDASKITELQDAANIARNSRSFRRFLRLVGHGDYRDQSKRP